MAIRRLLVAGLLLLFVLPSVTSQADFACFASTDCHGATVQSLPGRGECCAGRGLSFKPTQMDDCRNCFTEEEFVSPGSEFFLAFFNNLDLQFLSLAHLEIRVGNLEERSQTVTVSHRLDESMRTIGALSSEEISVDKNLRTESIANQDNAIVVQSMEQGQISVTALGDELTSSDTFHALPCVHLPSLYEYYAVSVQRSAVTQSDGDEVFVADPLGNSVFIVVGTEDNTDVTLNLTQTVTVRPGIVAEEGVPTTVTVGRAETLFVSNMDDLTGSHVVSNKPIAMLSGHECGTIPASLRFCDQMVEQIPPTSTWGKEFYTVPLASRTMDGFKVISSRDDNVLRGACSSMDSTTVLLSMDVNIPTAGKAVDFNISSDSFCHFESDYPALLVQFSLASEIDDNKNADPFMTIIPPARQYQNSYMVDHFEGASPRDIYYVNIIYLGDREEERDGLRLDGQPLDSELQWTEIKCRTNLMATCAYGVQLEMDNDETVHLSHLNSNARFMAISYTMAFTTGRSSFSGMAQEPIALDVVTIDEPEYRVLEGSGEANITLSRSGDMLDDIIIPFRAHATLDATNPAIPDEDFLEVEMDVMFPAGTSSVVVSVPFTMDDIFPEEDKVFEVYLGASPGVYITPIAYVNVTIENDDPPLPVMNVSFSETSFFVSEGVGFLNLTLVKTDGAVGPVTVSLFTMGGSAVEFQDFEPVDMNVTFAKDVTQINVEIVIDNDEVLEADEEFFIMMEPVEGLFPLNVKDGMALVQLTDNDVVVIGFQSPLQSVNENIEAVFANVQILHGGLDREVVVLCISEDGQASEENDYVGTEQLLTFNSSNTENVVTVSLIDDAVPEDTESFTLRLSLVAEEDSNVVVIPDQTIISISDDDGVSLTLEAPDSVQESAGSVDVTVSIDTGDKSGQVLVGITTLPGSARAIEDFQSLVSQEIRLGGEIDTQTISIDIYDNEDYDNATKTFIVQLSILESDFDSINPTAVQIQILDDDERPPLDTQCIIMDSPSETVASPEECCVTRSGSGYMVTEFTIPCIVIGFSQTSYTLSERSDPYLLPVEVVTGGLAMNLSITVIPEPDTATASDYTVSPWVVLKPDSAGLVNVTLVNEPDPTHVDQPVEIFRLELIEQTGITPPNVFFRGTSIEIMDTSLIRD